MIRNLFIIKQGISLVQFNFGECHSLGTDPDLIAGFVGALDSLSKEIGGSVIKSVLFEDYTYHFFKDKNNFNLLYVVITDVDDNNELINSKIQKISSLFVKDYKKNIKNFSGEVSLFKPFKGKLVKMNVAQDNCGNTEDCVDCENQSNNFKDLKKFEDNNKGFLSRLKSSLKTRKNIENNN